MGIAHDIADALSGTQAFFGSAIGSGVISGLVTFPAGCDIDTFSCTTVLGTAPMSSGAAAFFSTGVAFALGALAAGLRDQILKSADKAAEEQQPDP